MQKLSLKDYPDEICKLEYKGKRYEMRLGKVEDSKIFTEDHGILTCFITLNFGGSVQGFGGYALDSYHKGHRKRTGKLCKEGKDWVDRVCKVFGVSNVSNAKDKIVFALYEEGDSYGLIKGIKSPDFETGEVFIIKDYQERWGFD